MQNLQLEATLLSCMMQDHNCAKEYGLLENEDFTHEAHQAIFTAIKELVTAKKQPDYMTVYEHLNQKLDLSYIMDICDLAPTTAGFRNYIGQIKNITLTRKVYYLADKVKLSNLKGKELAQFVEKEIFNLNQQSVSEDFISIKEIVLDSINKIESRYMSDGLEGLSTGYKAIDKITDGLKKQDLIILAARPSMGKTALALNISQNIATSNEVAIFSLEMSKEQLVRRMILSESMVASSKIKEKKMDDDDWRKLTQAGGYLYNSKVHIYDRNNLSVHQMASICRKLKRQNGLSLVVIDYLQLIPFKGDRYTGITQISMALKGMAKELDCPVIVLSQLNRSPDARTDHRPVMSDLRESGQIEQDADVIMFLYRDEYYNPETDKPGVAELIFAKQRNNPVGIVNLGWIAECTKFVDYGLLERRGK